MISGMIRRPRRYTKAHNHPTLRRAMEAVAQGVMSLRSAEKHFKIPRTTLQRYIKQGIPVTSLRKLSLE